MVDGEDREVTRQRCCLRGRDTNDQAAGKPRSARDSDAIHFIEAAARLAQRQFDDRIDCLSVPAACDLRHDPAVLTMELILTCEDIAFDRVPVDDDRSRGVVARGLDPQ